MKILVINGSPKGEDSVTLQTVLYLEKLHPEHTFEVLHVGKTIAALEKNFAPAVEAVERAELLLFTYPVYTFLVPYQLHRFIELMKEHGVNVQGKYASQLSTSKHFFDVTAHGFIRDNCEDLGLKVLRGLSADMDDLTEKKGQKEAEMFFDRLCWQMEQGHAEPVMTLKGRGVRMPVTVPEGAEKQEGDVVIITDAREEDVQLQRMIQRFQAVLPLKTRVVNLWDYPFRGGCLGCFRCAVDGTCVYQDGFDTFLRTQIQQSQATIYAFNICDHSMGSRFKLYDDRQFCNGHRTVTMGMPEAYIISGDYSVENNLQMLLEARCQVGSNPLAGIATDERDPDGEIDQLAASVVYALEHKFTQPQNFYGVGGMKIFRDLIYVMRGFMKADHRFYKAHGQYDFPQKKKIGEQLEMHLIGWLMSSPKIRAKMGHKIIESMVAPMRKVVEKAGK